MKLLDEIDTRKEKARLVLDNVLFATNFSLASEVGLRYALALARHYHSKIYIVPAAEEARAGAVRWVMELRLSGQLDGIRHETPVLEKGEK